MQCAIMIPTYNEREAIALLLPQIAKIQIPEVEIQVLVIDDNSPDRTSEYVASLELPFVKILNRTKKEGLGRAYMAGIKFLLQDQKITHLISMDADGSHRVVDLVKLIESAKSHPKASLIIGSRWVKGGGIVNWPFARKLLSKAGTAYAKFALKMKITDLTGGFKVYPRWAVDKIDLEKITSNGYCYQIEMTHAFSQLSAPIVEEPITFIEREVGVSKMNQRIVIEAMWQVTRWGLTLRFHPSADKLHYVK